MPTFLLLKPNASAHLLPEAAARQLDRDKARCTLPVSSSPPLRTRRATCTAPGSTPAVLLQGPTSCSRPSHCSSLHGLPRGQLARALGTLAPVFPPARGLRHHSSSWVSRLPGLSLLCPIPLSPLAGRWRKTFPSHSFPPALGSPRGVSRVPPARLAQPEGGGVLLLAPSALCGSPALVLPLPARVGWPARLADSSAKVCQGQPGP
jgi:hypothetical protein